MINVSQGNNEVYVTLGERLNVALPSLYLAIREQGTEDNEQVVSIQDLAASTDRVNRFALEIVATTALADLTTAKVHLEGGDYTYEIFMSQDALLVDFDKATATSIERGFLRYNTTAGSAEYVTPVSNTTTYNG